MSGPALHLAVEIDGDGAHPAAWRRAAHAPDQLLTPRRAAGLAAVAENAGFTLITLDDGVLPPGAGPDPVGRIGAVERAAFVAASTSTIGVAPVVPVTYAEPFHVSSQLASLDHISAGRAGWVVAEEEQPAAARVWGRPLVGDAAGRARESRDGVEVARALWDSWEDDAVIRSVATSRYLDRDRLHYIDFTGETYAVKGPAIVPRPPQGQLVVLGRPDRVPADRLDVALVEGRVPAAGAAAAARARDPAREPRRGRG
ncbi:LLM class flavin-dependent oxidoreductase, partial [Streptomyces sp. NPDC059627]